MQWKAAAMMIADAQIHLWAKGKPSAHHRQTPFLREEALAGMDAAGVDRAVIHPVMWDPDSNELAVEAVRAHPDRFAIMGWFYLDQAEQRAAIDTWKSRPGMKGLRFYFSDPRSQSWPDDGTLDWLWPVAERLDILVSLRASAFLPRVGEIAARHPGLKISIDHMGVPRATQGAAEAYRNLPRLLALARHPNVAVKATGQAGYALDAYPFPSIHDALHRVFDAFGPRRMFWGTDITRMHCTWHQCVTLFTEELPWLKGADLDLVMGQAFCDWIGWVVAVR
jgi:predicted TIM-barrel fold metal-dependent hydrolase